MKSIVLSKLGVSGERTFVPDVFTTHPLFFLRGEVILDHEDSPDLFHSSALDHESQSVAASVDKSGDIQVVGRVDDLSQELVVDEQELHVPGFVG